LKPKRQSEQEQHKNVDLTVEKVRSQRLNCEQNEQRNPQPAEAGHAA